MKNKTINDHIDEILSVIQYLDEDDANEFVFLYVKALEKALDREHDIAKTICTRLAEVDRRIKEKGYVSYYNPGMRRQERTAIMPATRVRESAEFLKMQGAKRIKIHYFWDLLIYYFSK